MAVDPSERQQRVQEIAAQIRSLSQELDALLSLQDLDPLPSPSTPPSSSGSFLPGARVEILNSRNNLRGHRGTITSVNRAFVFFKLDSSGTIVWRARHNLRLL